MTQEVKVDNKWEFVDLKLQTSFFFTFTLFHFLLFHFCFTVVLSFRYFACVSTKDDSLNEPRLAKELDVTAT